LYHFDCNLNINIYESIGNIDVSHSKTGKPVPKTYIKVFSKMRNGAVEFYKDGYTDISGRFDFASISVDKLKNVEKFSFFISHDEFGSKLTECNPPLNL